MRRLILFLTAAFILFVGLSFQSDPNFEDGVVHAQGDALKVLIFSKTAGFRHQSIGDGINLIETEGDDRNWTVDKTEDGADFSDQNLAAYDVVVWLSTSGDVLNETEQAAFERYIQNGGGYVGIHAASNTEYDWPWYGNLVGAYFTNHPQQQDADLVLEDRTHPSTAFMQDRWTIFDEWYNFDRNPRTETGVTVLLTLDEMSYSGGDMGVDHPIAWYHFYDGGRSWYTAMGHRGELFTEEIYADFQRHIIEGIIWAAGNAPTPTATPTATQTPLPVETPSPHPTWTMTPTYTPEPSITLTMVTTGAPTDVPTPTPTGTPVVGTPLPTSTEIPPTPTQTPTPPNVDPITLDQHIFLPLINANQ